MPGANERVDRALERREGAALDVLEEVLLVHLHEVGCVVRRKLGRQLVPGPTPFRRLRCGGRARVNGFGMDLNTSRRLPYNAIPVTKFIDSEPTQSTTISAQRINVARPPIAIARSISAAASV